MRIIDTSSVDFFALLKKIRRDIFKKSYINRVQKIIDNVRLKGDEALLHYTNMFDGVSLNPNMLFVPNHTLYEIAKDAPEQAKKAIDIAAERIFKFHNALRLNTIALSEVDGSFIAQHIRPLERVGVYVPGGTAPLISSVLMNALPALCAGVKEIYIATPPQREGQLISPLMAYAAAKVNATGIYLMGGAQAIAAMAFGTKTVKKVDKIVGPGNIYVTIAKKMVYGYVDIDMVAGPSEILVLADESANPKLIAADLLSQLEHDTLASAFLVTPSKTLAKNVRAHIKKQMPQLARQSILSKSMKNCYLLVTPSMDMAVKLSNEIAPEHFELMVAEPELIAPKIKNAGALFIGSRSVEAIGDYVAGPSHTLPTSGSAAFFSPLNTHDFYKKMSVIQIQNTLFQSLKSAAIQIAQAEGLDAHKISISIRDEEQ